MGPFLMNLLVPTVPSKLNPSLINTRKPQTHLLTNSRRTFNTIENTPPPNANSKVKRKPAMGFDVGLINKNSPPIMNPARQYSKRCVSLPYFLILKSINRDIGTATNKYMANNMTNPVKNLLVKV